MVYDLHNDLLTAGILAVEALKKYDDAPLHVVFAVWTSVLKPSLRQLCDMHTPECGFSASVAVEDLGSVKCETEEYEQLFAEMRPTYVSLTWNGENPLGGGCGYESPLTEKGKTAVAMLAKAGIPLDLSHLSDKAFYSALEEADKRGARVLVTHTAARALCSHPRNLTDEMAREIAARNGLIGVAAVPNFLENGLSYGENCDVNKYADHIMHLCSVAGANRVAVGTDYYGTAYTPTGLENYKDFDKVADALARRGLNGKEIKNIFYENARNFMR